MTSNAVAVAEAAAGNETCTLPVPTGSGRRRRGRQRGQVVFLTGKSDKLRGKLKGNSFAMLGAESDEDAEVEATTATDKA